MLEKTTSPVARKAHVCEQCGRTIHPGERYHRFEQPSEYTDGFETFKTCDQCRRLERDLWDIDIRGEDDYSRECYVFLPEVHQNGYDLPTEEPWPTRFALLASKWQTPDGVLAAYPDGGAS